LTFDYEHILAKTEGVAMIRQNMDAFKDKLIDWVANPDKPIKQQIKPELVFSA